ncbi:hypothetical protein [Flavobacterium sp.]|jgi:hypothetical protein|uniref:hypothetical protein n=1 Tax=Flavobacterium sp. TaxID=239 RepID=UPI003340ECFE
MKKIQSIFNFFLNEKFKEKSEHLIIYISIFAFIIHLMFIFLNKLDFIHLELLSKLFNNPIAAIYTPFSFILIYEVYLLVYYLPKSTTIYIGKQYEIILLIIIRRIFKDISNLELTSNWFAVKYDLIFLYDIIAVVVLFFLIFIFYRLSDMQKKNVVINEKIERFILTKNKIASFLIPILLFLSLYSFINWIEKSFFSVNALVYKFEDINKIFFEDFFTVLILVDVLILLFSFLHSDKFSTVIRNSGFIISTIMIKLSFNTEGILNVILLVLSVVFGIIILFIHNKYGKLQTNI